MISNLTKPPWTFQNFSHWTKEYFFVFQISVLSWKKVLQHKNQIWYCHEICKETWSNIRSCMKYCSHVLTAAPNCYHVLNMLINSSVVLLVLQLLLLLNPRFIVYNTCLFYKYCLGRYWSELTKLFLFLIIKCHFRGTFNILKTHS